MRRATPLSGGPFKEFLAGAAPDPGGFPGGREPDPHGARHRAQRARARARDPHAARLEHPDRRGAVPRRPRQGASSCASSAPTSFSTTRRGTSNRPRSTCRPATSRTASPTNDSATLTEIQWPTALLGREPSLRRALPARARCGRRLQDRRHARRARSCSNRRREGGARPDRAGIRGVAMRDIATQGAEVRDAAAQLDEGPARRCRRTRARRASATLDARGARSCSGCGQEFAEDLRRASSRSSTS